MVEDTEERYPGEARGLALFLERIRAEAERELGTESMLVHAIRRALTRRSLARLRQARRLFNRLPRETRRRLIEAALACGRRADRERPGAVRFLMAEDRPGAEAGWCDQRPEADVVVRIRPGTLPGAAAARLRELADRIERERGLLSGGWWLARAAEDRPGPHRDRSGG